MTSTQRSAYLTPRDVVLLLEWDAYNCVWEESPYAIDMFKQGQLHVFASSSGNSYITFSGEDRIRIDWLLLDHSADIRRIQPNACGIPTDYILKTIPDEIMREFDDMLYSDRLGMDLSYEPSLLAQEAWEELTGERVFLRTPEQPVAAVAAVASKLPKHVEDVLLANAVRTKQDCPIAMEPITQENGSVTSCGHIFTKDALANWLRDRNTCPECRAKL
jgi:hypothetical protein